MKHYQYISTPPRSGGKLVASYYVKIFKNLQLAGLYVLYNDEDGFDFTKQKSMNVTGKMKKLDAEIVENPMLREEEQHKWCKRGWNVDRMALDFPYRIKIAMVQQKKPKNLAQVKLASEIAISYYMYLATHVLRESYNFTWDDMKKFWVQIVEFCRLYVDGMIGKDVLKYFEEIENIPCEGYDK